jgi:hypothetical protein
MKIIGLVFFTFFLFACANKNEIDLITEQNLGEVLNNSALAYKKCKDCKLSGLEGQQLIGFSDRYPPKGNYDKKEIEIGTFEYDAYQIFDPKNEQTIKGQLVVCYFNQEQKEKFVNFSKYYVNRIMHFKQLCDVKYLKNTVIISIENPIF